MRDSQGKFIPGHSGNPNGRPSAIKEIVEIARQESPESIRVLVAIRDSKKADARARIQACKEILDRGIGKAAQIVRIESEENSGKVTVHLVRGDTRKSKRSDNNDS